jgi:excisionase family DNA binding protein
MLADTSAADKPAASLEDFDLLTLLEVAKLLHCSKAHVSNVIAGKVQDCPRIPAVRLGRRLLVRREALALWLTRNETANDNTRPANDNLKTTPERDRRSA